MVELIQSLFQSGRLPHGILVCGDGGAEFGWAAAQTLLCDNRNACGTCGPCLRIVSRQSEAVLQVEPEKGVIKLEQAARINQFLALGRMTRARIIVVHEAHLLNVQATNAILKLVEEPPEDTYFFFVAPDPGLLLPTLRSRLQIVRLKNSARHANPDLSELRAPVVKFLAGCLKGEASSTRELLDSVEGREQAEAAARCLQEILRDWTVLGQGETLTGQDEELKKWPSWDVNGRVELWRQAHRMESDLHHHVDRSLVFENFYYQVRHAVD
jgi:DNA polymerase III delta prime subunit